MQTTNHAAESLYPHLGSVTPVSLSKIYAAFLPPKDILCKLRIPLPLVKNRGMELGPSANNATDCVKCTARGPGVCSLLYTGARLLEQGNFWASPANGQQARRACLAQSNALLSLSCQHRRLPCPMTQPLLQPSDPWGTGHTCQTGPQIKTSYSGMAEQAFEALSHLQLEPKELSTSFAADKTPQKSNANPNQDRHSSHSVTFRMSAKIAEGFDHGLPVREPPVRSSRNYILLVSLHCPTVPLPTIDGASDHSTGSPSTLQMKQCHAEYPAELHSYGTSSLAERRHFRNSHERLVIPALWNCWHQQFPQA
ncbi:UNVERIFIED_CONTAM: hypothetical protein K2H54_022964 [Gekko kuhli]